MWGLAGRTRRVRVAGACAALTTCLVLAVGARAEAAGPPPRVVGELTELRTPESRTYVTDRGTMMRTVSQSVTATGVADCEIGSGTQANTSTCGSTTNRVGKGSNVRRTIMRLDDLPEGVIVLDATLRLWDVGGAATRVPITLNRLTRPFGDGVTWNRASSAVAWTWPGGDIAAAESYSSSPTSQATSGEWVSWRLPFLVQDWIDGRTPPGFVLKQASESTSGARTFASAEGLNAARAPQLVIEYVPRSGDALHYTFEDIPLDDGRIRVNLGTGYATVEMPGALGFGPPSTPFTPIHHPARTTSGELGIGTTFSISSDTYSDARGASVDLATPDGGRWLTRENSGGGTATMPYGFDGELRAISDGNFYLSRLANSSQLRFNYSSGRLLAWSEHGDSWTPTYTPEGQLTQATSAGDGHVISVTERVGGRITRMETEDEDRTFLYDAAGRLTAVESSGERLITLARSARGVPFEDLTATLPTGRTVTLEFDALGRVLRLLDSDPDRPDLSFAYGSGTVAVTRDGQVTMHHHSGAGQVFSPDTDAPVVDLVDGAEEDSTASEAGDGVYVDGVGVETLTVPAHDARSGVASVSLRRGSNVIATSSGRCGVAVTGHADVCEPKLSVTAQIDASAWPEGETPHEATTVDLAGNHRVEPLGVYVDRTPPTGPTAIAITAFDPATSAMEVGFEQGEDPALPGGVPGSAVTTTRIRHRIGTGAWSSWDALTENDYPVSAVTAGQVVQLEFQSVDTVGNAGTVRSASLVVGAPPSPDDEDISGPGTAELRVVLRGAPTSVVPGQPLPEVPIVIVSSTEWISSRTDSEGVAVFPGLPAGEYEIDRYGPRPRTVTLAEGETRTVELNADAMSLLIDDDNKAVEWCQKPWFPADMAKKVAFCRAWEGDANTAIRVANRLYNVQTLFDENGDTIIRNDGTIANSFQHMFWNALVIDTIDDANWILGLEEGKWMEDARYLIDNRYEFHDRINPDLVPRRRSRVDVWNNQIGRGWMSSRMDRGLKREVICDGIRRRATTAIKVQWTSKRSSQVVSVLNRDRPLWIKRNAFTAPNTDPVAARLLPPEAFASGNPCDPLTEKRSEVE